MSGGPQPPPPPGSDAPESPFPPGFRAKVLRNTLFGLGGRVVGLAASFLLTPYVVHRLGTDRYALYALASAVTGYLALLDLGIGTGYVKYVAESAARHDDHGVNEVLSTGFYAYLGFGAALLGVWLVARHAIVRALGVGEALHAEAVSAFTVAVLVLALSGASAAFRAVLYGLQRIDAATRIGVALVLPRVLLTVALLEGGLGLRGVLLADFVLFLGGTAAMAWASLQFFPALSLRPGRVTRASFRRLFGYGIRLQVSRLSEMVNFQLDKLLLARFVGLRSVTDYELGARLLATARSFPLLLLNALVPAVSELEARGAGEGIGRIASRSLRYLLLVATPLFALLAVAAPRFIDLWLELGHAPSALAVRVLAAGYLLNVASGAFTSVTQGIARNDYQMKLALLGLALNAALSLALVWRFGYAGVLLGTGTALVLTYVYADRAFRTLVRHIAGKEAAIPWRTYLAPAVAALAAAGAALALDRALPAPAGRIAQAAGLAAIGVAFTVVYGGVLVAAGGVDRDDLRLGREARRLLRGKRQPLG